MSRRHVPIYRTFSAPTFPPDLGFYDLRLLNPGWARPDLARGHGIQWILLIYHYLVSTVRASAKAFERCFVPVIQTFPSASAGQRNTDKEAERDATGHVLAHQEPIQQKSDIVISGSSPRVPGSRLMRIDGKAHLSGLTG